MFKSWLFLISLIISHQIPLVLDRKRILVIGAGAGGSSFVYALRNDSRFDISVYEQSSIVGGRAKALNFHNSTIELGASIFSINNFLMLNASKEFNLQHSERIELGKFQFGIWDGNEWLYKHDGSWLGNLKFLWRYGFRNGPLQAKKVLGDFATKFFRIYDQLKAGVVFRDLASEVEKLGLESELQTNCKAYYMKQGISELYIDEVMGSILRNIYLSNVYNVHSVACSVGLYATSFDTFSIKNGNYQLFQRMLDGPAVSLNTKVLTIEKIGELARVEALKDGKVIKQDFDNVIIASPLQNSDIRLIGYDKLNINEVEYIKLHVTLVLGVLNKDYFSSESIEDIPTDILTPARSTSPFHCLSIHEYLNSTHTIAKLFSDHELSNEELYKFYTKVEDVARHNWNHPGSYPKLLPRSQWNFTINDGNLWYLNAMEPFISTMETSGLSALNAANYFKPN